MDWPTIIGVAIGLTLFALLCFLVDKPFDRIFEFIFRRLGLSSGKGPLSVSKTSEGDLVVLQIENKGKYGVALAAVEARDGRQQRQFPVPYLDAASFEAKDEVAARKVFASALAQPGEPLSILLDAEEIAALDCRSFAVLDADGRSWSVSDE